MESETLNLHYTSSKIKEDKNKTDLYRFMVTTQIELLSSDYTDYTDLKKRFFL